KKNGMKTHERFERLKRLSLHLIKVGPWASYSAGGKPGSHAKLAMVGDARGPIAFYLGSQNLYAPWSLSEYGYIVDNREAALALYNQYWKPLWTFSSGVAPRDFAPVADADSSSSDDDDTIYYDA